MWKLRPGEALVEPMYLSPCCEQPWPWPPEAPRLAQPPARRGRPGQLRPVGTQQVGTAGKGPGTVRGQHQGKSFANEINEPKR